MLHFQADSNEKNSLNPPGVKRRVPVTATHEVCKETHDLAGHWKGLIEARTIRHGLVHLVAGPTHPGDYTESCIIGNVVDS